MTVSLRDATAEDAEAVAAIYVDSWNDGFGRLMPRRVLDSPETKRWQRELAAPTVAWRVAVDADEVVGFAGTGPSRHPLDPGLGELETIAVAPSHWRRGIGTALMQDALSALSGGDFREAILWTLADYSQGDAFYRSCGWRPDGRSRAAGRQLSYRHPLLR